MATWAHSASGFGFGDDMLRICGVFIQLRGSRHLARLRSVELPFTNWAGFAESYHPAPHYQRLIRIAAQLNLRVHSLAATEDEVEEVLQAFEAGKLADLVVLSNDPLQIPEEGLPDLHAHLTFLGGRVVYDSGVVK